MDVVFLSTNYTVNAWIICITCLLIFWFVTRSTRSKLAQYIKHFNISLSKAISMYFVHTYLISFTIISGFFVMAKGYLPDMGFFTAACFIFVLAVLLIGHAYINIHVDLQMDNKLEERDALKAMKLAALREDLQKGIDALDNGEGTPLDMEAIKAKARSQHGKLS